MDTKGEIYEIIDTEANPVQAIYKSKDLALYCIEVALEHLAARRRARTRRELRTVIQPEFVPAPGGVTGRVVLSKKTQKQIVNHSRELFSGWMINATISLGDATKENLLEQAAAERGSAKGHILNAQFYEALAEPLEPGQTAASYWKPKEVKKLKDSIWDDSENKRPRSRA